jgi:NAD kinase
MTDEQPTTAKVSEEDFEKVMDAAARQELAKKSFEDLTRDERIKLALEEVDWIVIGGQDGQEFYGSIQFIRKVLKSFR